MSPLFILFISAILIVVIVVVVKVDQPGPQSAGNVVQPSVRLQMSNDVLVRDQTFLNGVPTFIY
jgi:hypothetical protein